MNSPTQRDIDVRPPHSGRVVREDNTFLNVADFWADHSTPFDTLDIGERTTLFELKSIYGLSYFRDLQTTAGSGSIGHNGPSFTLDTTASGSDSARLESAEIARYVPGLVAEPTLYVQTDDSSLSGDEFKEWGYGDGMNSLHFGQDSTGLYVELLSDGSSDHKKYQSDWNVDTLDGSGGTSNPSGLNLDVTEGHIYRIPFIWYGSGPALWQVLIQQGSGDSELVTVHTFGRTDGEPLIQNPNLPIFVDLDNNGSANAQTADVQGRSFAVIGDYEPNRRVTSETLTGQGVGTSGFTHLMSFRRKANVSDGAFFEAVSVKLGSMSIITDQDLQVLVTSNSSLSSQSFGSLTNVSDAETALELDTSGTLDTVGESIWEDVIAGGGGNKTQFASVDPVKMDFVRRDEVSVLASAIDNSATVGVTLRCREEW